MNLDIYDSEEYRSLYVQCNKLKIAHTFDSMINNVQEEISLDLIRQLDICGIHLDDGSYVAVLVRLDEQEYFPVDGQLGSGHEDSLEKLQRRIEQYFLGKFVIYTTQLSGMIVVFQHYSKAYPLAEHEALELARAEWKNFLRIMLDHYGVSFSVAMSNLYHGMHGLAQSYYQCRDLIAYGQFTGQRFCCADQPAEPHMNFIEDTVRLYDIVRKTVYLLFHEVYTQQIAMDTVDAIMVGVNGSLHLVQYRCNIFFALLLVDLQRNGLDLTKAKLDPYFNKLFEFRTQTELTDCIDALLSRFFQLYGVQTSLRHGTFCIMEVINYVHEHLHEPSLNVTGIADHFQLSQPNLSYHFKRETGLSLSEYISQKRLEYALKLLVDTDDVLDKIAENAGYGSTMTFQRAVKKTFNLTPREYREKNRK